MAKKEAKKPSKSKKSGEKNRDAVKAKEKASKEKKMESGPHEGEKSIYFELKLIVLFLFSVLLALSVHGVPMGIVGEAIRDFLSGLFSVSMYFVPYFFMGGILVRIVGSLRTHRKRYLSALLALFLAQSLFVGYYTRQAAIPLSFRFSDIALCYRNGIQFKGAGLLGNLLFVPLYKFLGKTGIILLIVALILIFLILSSKFTFSGMMKFFGRSLKKTGEKAVEGGKRLGSSFGQSPPPYDPDALGVDLDQIEFLDELGGFQDFDYEKALSRERKNREALELTGGDEAGEVFAGRRHGNFKFIDLPSVKENFVKKGCYDEPFESIDDINADIFSELSDEGAKKLSFGLLEEKDEESFDLKFSAQGKEGVEAGAQAARFEGEAGHGTDVEAALCAAPAEREAGHDAFASEMPCDVAADLAERDALEADARKVSEAAEASDGGAKSDADYALPSFDLLIRGEQIGDRESELAMTGKAAILEETFRSFKIDAYVTSAVQGPMITRFEVKPRAGVKISKIAALSDDIALRLAATNVRILAPIPGKSAVGIEVPNDNVSIVRLRDVLESKAYQKNASKIKVGLGKDISGEDIVADLAKMPHLLIAGATGSGKSVCVNTIISSILFNAKPGEVKFLMIDPKVVELSVYNGIPHLLLPVVTDPSKASVALSWAVNEMTQRYKKFAEYKVRDISSYNEKFEEWKRENEEIEEAEADLREHGILEAEEDLPPEDVIDPLMEDLESEESFTYKLANGQVEQRGMEFMPRIVIIIDELADLMVVAGKQVEESIARLAQMARAAGMHLIVATQRPSVDVITGLIKANIPSRIAFAVSSQIDSRTILDEQGADKLLGKGDMLFLNAGTSRPIRVQGALVTDHEVEDLVSYVKQQFAGDPDYDDSVVDASQVNSFEEEGGEESDELLDEAVRFVLQSEKASTSMIQRKFRIGYNRAARIIEEMEEKGVVGPSRGAKPREILISSGIWESRNNDA